MYQVNNVLLAEQQITAPPKEACSLFDSIVIKYDFALKW